MARQSSYLLLCLFFVARHLGFVCAILKSFSPNLSLPKIATKGGCRL